MSIYDKASLVLIPSGTKTSKVYSQKPTNGDGDFTFSRSTAATRVNADGNIEKETSNLLLQSNTFSTTWVKVGYTLTSGQAGYDGTNDAWLANCTGAGNALYQTSTATGVSTFSIYVKAGTAAYARIRADQSTDAIAVINLSDGSIESESGTIKTTATDVGGGWYRCAITWNIDTLSNVQIRPSNAAGNAITGTLYIQDAQLEQGLVARDYIETTTAAVEGGITDNVPRLDYTDSSCPALLLEPQRTNLITNSEHLESSYYGKTRCTIEDNSTTSPEGVINASKMTSTDASESYIQGNVTTTGTKMSWSFFAKKGDLDYCHGLVWSSPNGCRQWFNLSTGAVGGTTTFGSGYSVDSASIEDYGNGWYRCTMIVNCSAGTQGCRVNISSADTTIGSAVNSYGYFYGLQAEDASYATSYIPTYGSAVTREGDRCINTSATSIVGQTQGSIFLEYDNTNTDSSGGQVRASIHSSGFTDWIFLGEESGNYRMYFRVNGSVLLNNQAAPANGTNKICIAYNESGDIRMFFNGSKVGTYSTAFTFNGTLNTIEFGNGGWNVSSSNAFKQYDIFPTALTDQEAIDLTTL